ncbi:ferrous iron transporter, partial [Hafnia paralvei]|nr:ferrous iron transporter [Hafnia paralvei]
MSIQIFRRTALSLALLALPTTAALAAEALPQVKISVNDKQ